MQTLEQQGGVVYFVSPLFLLTIFMWDSFGFDRAQFHSAWLMILSIHKCVGVMLLFIKAVGVDSHNHLKPFSSESQHVHCFLCKYIHILLMSLSIK